MEAYPGDLLAGVSPLVFAVDAITPLPSKKTPERSDETDDRGATQTEELLPKAASHRSLFDLFLDSLASALFDADESTTGSKPRNSNNNTLRSDALNSLLRVDDDDSSEDEDPLGESSSQLSKSARNFRRGVGSPSLGMANFRKPPSSKTINTESTAYARNLTTENFFQRARIVASSSRHGFPPSKDEAGVQNFALKLSQARSAMAMNPTNANAYRLKGVLESKQIDGILPLGWLEKHAHALPSVLVFITSYQGSKEHQDKQDQRLFDTVEHMRESLATKRDCSIHLVVLTENNSTSDEWISRIRSHTQLQANDITVIQIRDINDATAGSGIASSPVMKRICKTLRDASWIYYQNQARQAKRKLSMLGHDHQPTLLPLAIRYSFKVAVFYEFQLKHEKAIKFFSESYRHLQTYYQQVLNKTIPWDENVPVNPLVDDGINLSGQSPISTDSYSDDNTAGIEVTLHNDDEDDDTPEIQLDVRAIFSEIKPPSDMAHQCRAVADWLNFKLVQAGLHCTAYSESEEGILAASDQWRKHSQSFLNGNDPSNPTWYFWKYVCNQRQVMAQLVERYPPKPILSLAGLARDEVLLRFSAWRNYSAAAEAMLRLGVEVRKASKESANTAEADRSMKSTLRGKFVGGLDSEGLWPQLHDELKRDHKEIALEMLFKAISLFKEHIDREKRVEGSYQNETNKFFFRSAARMHYLIGGILLGQKKHKLAIRYLEETVKDSSGWNGLEFVVRRMLIECYEKYVPQQDETSDEKSKAVTSMILDSYFNAEMSSKNLRRALNNFSSLTGGEVIKWHHECIDEFAPSLPFSFAVTFPCLTHATTGDTITASVMIKSNLDFAVHMNSVTLLSMAGNISVPSTALRSAENANEGSDGGIIIQANTSILFSTLIDIPRDLDSIATDESGNGGEKEGIAGKGSFSTSARPRTAGITSAAGARLISEQAIEKRPKEGNAQWSLKYLGGKTLRCDGMCLVFYPVHTENAAASGGTVNVIELTIVKKQNQTIGILNIKRTPFEEDNYIASAWARLKTLPLIRGPRCLRVLGPMPQMIVTNLTDPMTNGKALEGTVNRIVLKLEAGPHEECREIRYKVTCSTTQLSLDGSTNLLDQGMLSDSIVSYEQLKQMRCPVLVKFQPNTAASQSTKYGFELPLGWEIVSSMEGSQDEVTPDVSLLKAGEVTYVYFDIYRPARCLPSTDALMDLSSSQATLLDVDPDESGTCQSDFDVSITYRQARPKTQQAQTRSRQRPSVMQNASTGYSQEKQDDEPDPSDVVHFEFNGTIVWTSPISASFSPVQGLQKTYPSGSRHPSNSNVQNSNLNDDNSSTALHSEVAMVDGETISTRCTFEANNVAPGMALKVSRIWFEEYEWTGSDRMPCAIRLVPDPVSKESDTLYSLKDGEPVQTLTVGTKCGVVYSVKADMLDGYKKGSVSDYLGVICVDWSPIPLALPNGVLSTSTFKAHGPLVLDSTATLKFRGPPCYVESAPFEAAMTLNPALPRVAMPFEVLYRIANKTDVHQKLIVSVAEQSNVEAETLLFCGIVRCEIGLSPFETQIIKYTAIAAKAGKTALPAISVSCERYNTWVINDVSVNHDLFVLP